MRVRRRVAPGVRDLVRIPARNGGSCLRRNPHFATGAKRRLNGESRVPHAIRSMQPAGAGRRRASHEGSRRFLMLHPRPRRRWSPSSAFRSLDAGSGDPSNAASIRRSFAYAWSTIQCRDTSIDRTVPQRFGAVDLREDELPIVLLCDNPIVIERAEDRRDIQPFVRVFEAGCGPVARPAIVLRTRDYSGADRIQHDVAEQFAEMRLPLDQDAAKPTLKEVSATLVAAIEPARVSPIEPMHAAREIRLGCLDHEVEMIRHQHPRGDAPPKALHGVPEKREEHPSIDVIIEDGPSFISAGRDVIERVGELDAKWSCHNAPRFPRMSPIAEGSPGSGKIAGQTSSEWKIRARDVYSAWSASITRRRSKAWPRSARREDPTPFTKIEGLTQASRTLEPCEDRRSDPQTFLEDLTPKPSSLRKPTTRPPPPPAPH